MPVAFNKVTGYRVTHLTADWVMLTQFQFSIASE